MEVTGIAQRQARRDRVLPPAERVRPGLWSVPVPIPRNPLRYVLTAGLRQAGTEVAARLAVQPGATAWEIAQELEWSRSWAETTGYLRRAALAETIAHLRSLRQAGRAGRREPAAGTEPGGGPGGPQGGPERWFPVGGETGDSAANNAG